MIFNETDTICAISTPPGCGGIAVVRVSGPAALAVVGKIWQGKDLDDVASHTAHLGNIVDEKGEALDRGVATVFRAPRSFTGEDVVELAVHGSRYIQRRLLEALVQAGARLAGPGEFTRRAFLNGRLDLAQAEAVADVIASDSRAAHRIAMNQMRGTFSKRLADLRDSLVEIASLLELELDFSEEDVTFASREKLLVLATEIHNEVTRLHHSFSDGRAIKEGIPVAIVGPTNAGKSSLLNAILGDDRAIVSDIHGTTRDTVEETIEIGDFRFRFIDTAGLRHTDDAIEQIGITRSLQAIDKASIVILTLDGSLPVDADTLHEVKEHARGRHLIIALNKKDLGTAAQLPGEATIAISTITGEGLIALQDRLEDIGRQLCGSADSDILVTNARHAAALAQAAETSARVIDGLNAGLPGDLIAQDLRATIAHLSEITGEIPSQEILTTIFSRFCIGK